MKDQLSIPGVAKGTDLIPHPDCNIAIPAFLLDLPWAQSDDGAVNDIVERLLAAESVDDILDRPEVVEFSSLVGKVITVDSVVVRPSTLAEGIGAYVVLTFRRHGSGTVEVTTTSAMGVMAQCAAAHRLGAFPMVCSVQEIDTGKKGRSNPLYLTRARVEASF